LSSGIERHILLHGVAQSSACTANMTLTDVNLRHLPDGTPEDHEIFLRAMAGSHSTIIDSSEESGDELDTIPLFDQ
jgi:WD repeat-containing protein 22